MLDISGLPVIFFFFDKSILNSDFNPIKNKDKDYNPDIIQIIRDIVDYTFFFLIYYSNTSIEYGATIIIININLLHYF